MKRFLQTRSDIAFNLEFPTVDMVTIKDIATSLAYTNRFNGHTGTTYSVAEHSVLVSRKCREENKMWGLLHDAAEAYTGDIISPLKKLVPQFSAVEKRIMKVICEKFELDLFQPKEIGKVDLRMLATERLKFFPTAPMDWSLKSKPYDDVEILCLPAEKAKTMFLTEFFLLRKNMLEAV